MKRLHLTKPHVIIMVGLPGSGKSTFAERFSEVFSAPLVSWEAIRTATQGSALGNRHLQDIANISMQELAKTEQSVIYDGLLLTAVSRKRLAQDVRNMGYTPLFLWVQTDLATARRRARKHGYTNETFEAAEKKFTRPIRGNDVAVISGKHTFASQLKSVLKHLGQLNRTEQPYRNRVAITDVLHR